MDERGAHEPRPAYRRDKDVAGRGDPLDGRIADARGRSRWISGPELCERFRAQSVRFGTRVFTETVTKVDLSRRPFTVIVCPSVRIEIVPEYAEGGFAQRLAGLPAEARRGLGPGRRQRETAVAHHDRGHAVAYGFRETRRDLHPALVVLVEDRARLFAAVGSLITFAFLGCFLDRDFTSLPKRSAVSAIGT